MSHVNSSTSNRLRNRSLIAGALALLLAPLAMAAGASRSIRPTDLAGLQTAERTWVRALEGGDAALLERFVDGEMSFIGPDGEFEDRARYLAGYRALPSMGVTVEKVDLHEVNMRVLGDTGIVTGRALARVKTPGGPLVENVRFTRVYQRRGDTWRMVAGQGTRIAPATPPATPPQGQ
jgi:ketosteroid isomerase-like protein